MGRFTDAFNALMLYMHVAKMYTVSCAQRMTLKLCFVKNSFVYNSTEITKPLEAESSMSSHLGKIPHASDQQRHVLCEDSWRGLVIAEAN